MDEHRVVCDCNARTKWNGDGWPDSDSFKYPEDKQYNVPCPHCHLFHWYEDDNGKPVERG